PGRRLRPGAPSHARRREPCARARRRRHALGKRKSARSRARRSRRTRRRRRHPGTLRPSDPTARRAGRWTSPQRSRRPRPGAACAEAVAGHAANGRILVIDDLRFDGVEGDRPRTRDIAGWLARVGDTGRAVLVTAEREERVGIAAANLKRVDLRTVGTLRLADVLRAETMLVHRPALEVLAARATVGAQS